MAATPAARKRIPRDPENDYTREAAEVRQAFVAEHTGAVLEHVSSYSFDPSVLQGNVENFTGAAQVPLGIAGPLLVNGEHAQGEFYVPLATAEGTLVASYNRGMRLLYEAGGVTTTVLDDRMQRAPAFLFAGAREAWVLRLRQGEQAGRDRGRDRALRRAVAGLGDRRRAVGRGARPARSQPALAGCPASAPVSRGSTEPCGGAVEEDAVLT